MSKHLHEEYLNSGFVFDFDGQLSNSKVIFADEISEIEDAKRNNDEVPLFVWCSHCSEYMDFNQGEFDELDGNWKCGSCDATVDESEIYEQIDSENNTEYEDLYL